MTATIPLYARTAELHKLDAWIAVNGEEIAANGGALPDEIAQMLDEAHMAFDEKCESVALFVRSVRASAKMCKDEKDRLARKEKAYENAADALESYLLTQMQAAGKELVKRPLATLAITQSPPSVTSSLDEAALRNVAQYAPQLVKRIPERWELDKDTAKAMHKLGQQLPDGVTVTRNVHLRIR